MSAPIVAVDIDNVVLDFQRHWARLHDRWFGTSIMHDHEMAKLAQLGLELADPPQDPLADWDALVTVSRFSNHRDFWRWFETADGWDTMPAIRGALGALYRLNELQVPWFFCTARPAAGVPAAEKLAAQFGVNVVFLEARDKHHAGADIFIDDSAVVIETCADKGRSVIRIHTPWNAWLADRPGPIRTAASLAAAVDLIEKDL